MKKSLFHLLHLFDPNLPIGAFSHSAGLETYVQQNLVHDYNTAKNFVFEYLSRNLFYNDAAYLKLAYDALENDAWEDIVFLDNHCHASKLPMETRMASRKLGGRLLKIYKNILDNNMIVKLNDLIIEEQLFGHLPVVYAVSAYVSKIDLESTLTGFYFNALVGHVTNCVKLIPLGQETGQQLIHESHELISDLVERQMNFDRSELGLSSIGFDLRSMQHETLYSRLYMS